jgi:GMP reductase
VQTYQLVINNIIIYFIKIFAFQHGIFTTIHKYYSPEEWRKFATDHPECLGYVAASSGTGQSDFERLQQILKDVPDIAYICLDVANGYSQHFVEYLRKVRAAYPTHTIIVRFFVKN